MIHKAGVFWCFAFIAVSISNAQLAHKHCSLVRSGLNQPLLNDDAQARYYFYGRTTTLLLASAGAWLYGQCRCHLKAQTGAGKSNGSSSRS
jgi:hypothetical protein